MNSRRCVAQNSSLTARASCRKPAVTQSRISCAVSARLAFPQHSFALCRDMSLLKNSYDSEGNRANMYIKKKYDKVGTAACELTPNSSTRVCVKCVCVFSCVFVYICYFALFCILDLSFRARVCVHVCEYVSSSVRVCICSYFYPFIFAFVLVSMLQPRLSTIPLTRLIQSTKSCEQQGWPLRCH